MPSNQSGRAADARGEILAAATRLFAAHGFDGVSLQDLADAVGLRKPSLLYHFSSKEELRQAVLDDVLARWNETLPAILLATTGEDQFTGVTKELVGFFARDPDRARLIIREALDRPADMRERLARNVSPVVVKLAHYLRSGQARGNLQEDVDPEAYLFQAISLFICGVAFTDAFGSLMPKRAREGAPKERLTRELLRIGKSALFKPPPAGPEGQEG